MKRADARKLLEGVRNGSVSVARALEKLSTPPIEHLGFATIDHHRELRQGFPEVILSAGKTPSQVAAIARRIADRGSVLLATRADRHHFQAIRKAVRSARYNETARLVTANEARIVPSGRGTILVVTAGTSDIPVAEEAAETARIMGNRIEKVFDVGVAGIHRLFAHADLLHSASVVIVVAGMEGALASVVGGLVDVPVIAVPTSVGYGASFAGLAPLLGMLNSCAAGVTVVNIDNGFGAGFAAAVINRMRP
jgi:NCAIR mutase (PurE)-related protein